MARRRTLHILLWLLGLFLLGTVVVLSSVSYYLAIDPRAYITELEVPILGNTTRWNATDHGKVERIPRILHQTWKSETLPSRWVDISKACRDMMADYDYMLWTDAGSRDFIADKYPWFLDIFDTYTYPIQRADAIRYFVLHHYGGVYLDLDIGCLRPLDPLLVFPVILPKTIPVGVSNDLMFAEKGHPFLAQTIHNLATFDHSWILNYPTVMFSTGPMFLSAQYGIYAASHPEGEVRILPKSLYGKNAKEGEAPHSFFSHFYGSSWHADDAAFIGFLGTWGKGLMWIGLVLLLFGLVKLLLPGNSQRKYSLRRIGRYEVLFPHLTRRNGRWNLDFTQPLSPDISNPSSPADDEVPFLPFNVRPSSPASSESSSPGSYSHSDGAIPSSIFGAIVRAGTHAVLSFTSTDSDEPQRTPLRTRRPRTNRGVLFFLPAIFTRSQDIELASHRNSPSPPPPTYRRLVPRSDLPPEKQRYATDIERAGLFADGPSDHVESSSQAMMLDLGDPHTIGHSRSRSTSRDSQ